MKENIEDSIKRFLIEKRVPIVPLSSVLERELVVEEPFFIKNDKPKVLANPTEWEY